MTKFDLHNTLLEFSAALALAAKTFEEFSDDVENNEATDADGEPLNEAIIHQLRCLQDATAEVLDAVLSANQQTTP